jgi:hypothetical protein
VLSAATCSSLLETLHVDVRTKLQLQHKVS